MILSSKPVKNYTKISNEIICNTKLSVNARLCLIYILSLPESFNVHLEVVAQKLDMSLRSVQRCIKELIAENILQKTRLRDKNGCFSGESLYVFEMSEDCELESVEDWQIERLMDKSMQNQTKEDLEDVARNKQKSVSKSVSFAHSCGNKAQKSQKDAPLAIYQPDDKNPPVEICRHNKIINNINKNKNIYTLAHANKLLILAFQAGKNLKAARTHFDFDSLKALNDEHKDALRQFLTYRAQKGKITPLTKELIIKKAVEIVKSGADLQAVVEQSILKGWSGLFVPKDAPNAPFAKYFNKNTPNVGAKGQNVVQNSAQAQNQAANAEQKPQWVQDRERKDSIIDSFLQSL